MKLSPRHPQWSRHYERPRRKSVPQKEIWVPFKEPLFLGKWYGVATYFFIQKIRKTKYMIELFSSLIEKKSLHN